MDDGRGMMEIHADLSQRAVVASDELPWVPSPMAGVKRRMIERKGDEVARVTSIVRYAAGSHFSQHTHIGGEEFLVLEGVFSDDYGDFPSGTYVRNPVDSKHKPHTDEGCVILVKLFWMHPGDQEFIRVDTTREDLWRPTDLSGVEVMELHRYGSESNALYRLAPGAALPERDLPGGEEFFVLDGSCGDASGGYREGSWVRAPIGSAPALQSELGCRLYVKRGHLLDPPAGPR